MASSPPDDRDDVPPDFDVEAPPPELFDDYPPEPEKPTRRLEGWFRNHKETIVCTAAALVTVTILVNMSSCNVLMHNGAAYLAEGVRTDLRRLEDRIHKLEASTAVETPPVKALTDST